MKSTKGSEPLQVLFLTYHLPLEDEPGAFRPWMEARLLKRAGYKVTVITCGVHYMTGEDTRNARGWCTLSEQEGIPILKTWAPKHHRGSLRKRIYNYLSFATLAAVAAFRRVKKVDVIFAGTDPIFLTPVIYLISRFKKAALVLDERDLYPETAIALGVLKPGFFSDTLLRWQQFVRRRAGSILAATPGIKRKLLQYGIPPEKLFLLYNADVFLSFTKKYETRYELKKLLPRKVLAGYVGGLGRANDVFTILKAAHRLQGEKDLGFVIVGSGEKREFYEEYCRKHRLNNVLILPAVPRKEARALIAQLDIGIQALPKHPHFSGTLTSKTFDYHALGIPMIFCGNGDTADLLQESGGGITVPPEDDKTLAEVLRVLTYNSSLRQQLGSSAQNWYKENINANKASEIIRKAVEKALWMK